MNRRTEENLERENSIQGLFAGNRNAGITSEDSLDITVSEVAHNRKVEEQQNIPFVQNLTTSRRKKSSSRYKF